MITLSMQGFVYGVPEPLPAIPGFVIMAREKFWLMAKRAGDNSGTVYVVESSPGEWKLHPVVDHGKRHLLISKDGAITIAK